MFGAYHFARPDGSANDAIEEADHFVDVAQLGQGDLLPVLDLERTGGLTPEEPAVPAGGGPAKTGRIPRRAAVIANTAKMLVVARSTRAVVVTTLVVANGESTPRHWRSP